MDKYQILRSMVLGREISVKKVYNISVNYIKFLARNPHLSSFPSILMMEPTNYCNLRCPLCPTGNGTIRAPRGFMSFDSYKRIIDEVGDYLLNLTLYNFGEPFLNKSLLDMVEYAKKKRIFIRISTNGHFLDGREKIERLVKSGLDHIIIALDAATEDTFQKYRKKGDFKKVVENIKKLVKQKKARKSRTPYIELLFVVMKHNEKEIPVIRKIAGDIGVDRLKLKTASLIYHSKNDKRGIGDYLPENKKRGRYKFKEGAIIENKKIKDACKWLWVGSVVNWDGAVVPCCYDPHRTLEMGNAFGGNNLRRVWCGSKYTGLRKLILRNKKAVDICRKCPGTLTGSDTD